MTNEEVLGLLAETSAAAIQAALNDLVPGIEAKTSKIETFDDDEQAFHDVEFPLALARVLYREAVIGGNIALLSEEGARKLADALAVAEGSSVGETSSGELGSDELLQAAGHTMNRIMSEAARIASEVLGHDVEVSEPRTVWVSSSEQLQQIYSESASAFSTRFEIEIFGERCLIIQLVPKSFLVKLSRALDELASGKEHDASLIAPAVPLQTMLRMPARISIEFGATRMSFERATELSPGDVINLERSTREPVCIYADNELIGYGALKSTPTGKLKIVIEEILTTPASAEEESA